MRRAPSPSVLEDTITWADFHPEVTEVYSHQWIPWSCKGGQVDTGLNPVARPHVAIGQNQEIFTGGCGGEVFHSVDGGRTWGFLGRSPSFMPQVPVSHAIVDSHIGGFGVTAERTLLFNWFLDYNAGGDRSWDNESDYRVSWLTWSDDQGKSWSASELLDPSPYQNIADGVRPVPIGDTRLLLPMCATGTTDYCE